MTDLPHAGGLLSFQPSISFCIPGSSRFALVCPFLQSAFGHLVCSNYISAKVEGCQDYLYDNFIPPFLFFFFCATGVRIVVFSDLTFCVDGLLLLWPPCAEIAMFSVRGGRLVLSGAAPPVPGAVGDGGGQRGGWGVEDPEDGQQGAGAVPYRSRPRRHSQDVLADKAR